MDFLLFPSCQVICAFLPQKCYFALYCFLPFPWLQSKINTLTSSCTQGEVWTKKIPLSSICTLIKGSTLNIVIIYIFNIAMFLIYSSIVHCHYILSVYLVTQRLSYSLALKKDPILNCCTLKYHPKDPTFHVRRHWVEYRTRRVK